jgi:ComF family protein
MFTKRVECPVGEQHSTILVVVGEVSVGKALEYSGATVRMPINWNARASVGMKSLLGLLYPPECVWCGEPTAFEQRLCDACRRVFVSDYYRCQKCATPLPSVVPNRDCFRCRDAHWRFSKVVTLGPYRGKLREAVILMKKPSFEPLRQAFGILLAEALLPERTSGHEHDDDGVTNGEEQPLIVPVPNHWTHGFSAAADTADSLARAVAAHTGWPVAARIVRRIRKTAKQGMLTWSERKNNVRSAFEIRSSTKLIGRHVMLVDDVLTSGATAAELAKLLTKAKAARVTIVVAARGTGVRESPET